MERKCLARVGDMEAERLFQISCLAENCSRIHGGADNISSILNPFH